jgi:hypothetical protein
MYRCEKFDEMKLPNTPLRAGMSVVGLVLFVLAAIGAATTVPDIRLFFRAASLDKEEAEAALEVIAEGWEDGYTSIVIDIARFFPSFRRRMGGANSGDLVDQNPFGPRSNPDSLGQPTVQFPDDVGPPSSPAPLSPRAKVRARLIRFLENQTGQRFGDDLGKWRKWMWNLPYEPHPDYTAFKSFLYGQVDRKMTAFFPPDGDQLIRLDEVDWGGVGVNGIPPLDHPVHIRASEAKYLDDEHIVFGIAINGEARAYPKRILAWHELARDQIGGVELAIVYCTLCGTVIPYGSEVGGQHRTFGTSGLLYRSNKLMFDEETMSLWSTAEGRPVIGELVGTGLELPIYPVVVTTWKEWRSRHPDTVVLSIETGFERDYSEGAAYRDYFRTDRLMFGVPEIDKRLKNKDEVLAILLRPKGSEPGAERAALALSAKFLKKNRLHHVKFAGYNLIVVTSRKGANRVYEAAGRRFVQQTPNDRLVDSEGLVWKLAEDALIPIDRSAETLPRVAARAAFWFGWYAQFPETELVR